MNKKLSGKEKKSNLEKRHVQRQAWSVPKDGGGGCSDHFSPFSIDVLLFLKFCLNDLYMDLSS